MDLEGKQSIRMVLHNLELLEKILRYHSRCNKTLVSAALTAKAFSEPAFNVLWYEIHSMWPLFHVFPTFERGTDGKYLFTGPIRNEHLQRVLYYAKRIRFLNYHNAKDDPYSNTPRDLITSTLMRMDKLGAFIPLRKIHLRDPLCNTVLLPLTSPNLDYIDILTVGIQPESTEIRLASFLQSFAQAPLLRSLAIDGPFTDITLQVLPDFINLHSLSMCFESPVIPVDFLKRFASSMLSLQHLQIDILDPLPAPPNDGPPHSRFIFPSLETLHVAADSTYLKILFNGLDAPLLESISLELVQHDSDDGAHMHRFVEKNQQLLNDKVDRVLIRTLYPSLSFVRSFEKLKDLVVEAEDGTIPIFGIVDTSWSHSLTRLRLAQWDPLNGVSIAALRLIADACPNLQKLEISIHLPEKPEKPSLTKAGQECQPHNLKNLVFLNLPAEWNDTISLAIEFVSLLEHLFPSMAVPKYTAGMVDKPGATREAWWRGVQDMWKMCQTIKNRKMSSSLCRCSHYLDCVYYS